MRRIRRSKVTEAEVKQKKKVSYWKVVDKAEIEESDQILASQSQSNPLHRASINITQHMSSIVLTAKKNTGLSMCHCHCKQK